MKKIIKSSILTILFLAALTVVSHAANQEAATNYGDVDSNGSMLVTVTFPKDVSGSAYDDLFNSSIANDHWTVDRANGTMRKTVTEEEQPFIHYYEGGPVGDGVIVKVATPYTINVGESFSYKNSTSQITASSNPSVVTYSGKTVTGVAAGESDLTISVTSNNNSYTYTHTIKVRGSDGGSNNSGDNSGNHSNPGGGTVDFSNATYSYSETYGLVIDNVEKTDNILYYIIDFNSSTDFTNNAGNVSYNKDKGNYYISLDNAAGDAIMQNKDTYIHIFERVYNGTTTQYVKIAEQKLPKPDLSALNKFSDDTFSANDCTQIILHGLPIDIYGGIYESEGLPSRKLHIKIGQITDSSILNAIRNEDSSGFSKLLAYAQSSTNHVVDITETSNHSNGYEVDTALTHGSNLIDGAYYYLYLVVDDEDGKYLPIESITLARAQVFPNLENYPWYLFFYGSGKFNFDGVTDDSSSSEEEKVPSVLPKTGEGVILLSVVVVLSAIMFIVRGKNKKYGNY